MDNFNTDSPLSTKAKRDKFVRQPLSVLGAETPKPRTRKKDVHNDPEETITPTSVPSSSNILKDVTDNRRPTRRSPRSIINATTSPPSSDFFTSSPITGNSDSFTSPQVSMINRKTPESQSSRKNVSRGSVTVKKTLDCEEEGSSESDESKTPSNKSKSLLSKSKSRRENQDVPRQDSTTNKSKRNLDEEQIKDSPFCAATSIVLATIVILMLSMFITMNLKPELFEENPETQISGKGQAFDRFKRDMEKVKANYPQQNPKSWSKLSGSIRRNMQGKAQQPLCFLFVFNSTAEATSNCLVNAVGTSIYFAINGGVDGGVFNIKSADLTKDPSEAKGELFLDIDSNLKQNSVVILEDISQLGASPVMALHGICDEGYLPDQAVKPVVLMTIADKGLGESLTAVNEFEYGANLIRSLWEKDLGTDKVHPLISRIASVVIKVLPETFKGCPHL